MRKILFHFLQWREKGEEADAENVEKLNLLGLSTYSLASRNQSASTKTKTEGLAILNIISFCLSVNFLVLSYTRHTRMEPNGINSILKKTSSYCKYNLLFIPRPNFNFKD